MNGSRADLPGSGILERGRADLALGVLSTDALLVAIAAGRLREAGVQVPELPPGLREPELDLYRALGETSDDPYFRYNSLLAELDSALSALKSLARPGRG